MASMLNFNSEDFDEDQVVYVPRLHRVSTQRFSAKKPELLDAAAQAWQLSLPQEDKLAVRLLNTYHSLLSGDKRLSAISGPMVTLLAEAMGFNVSPAHTTAELRDELAPFFYREDDLQSIPVESFHQVSDELLREWAFMVGVDYTLERPDLVRGLLEYQQVFQDPPEPVTQHRREITPPADIVKQGVERSGSTIPTAPTVTSLLTASSPHGGQNKRPRLSDESPFCSQALLDWSSSKPGLCKRIVPVMGREIRTGYTVVYISGDLNSPDVQTTLFISVDDNRKLLRLAGDALVESSDHDEQQIVTIPNDCKVFVLNASGLAATSSLLGRWGGFVHAPPEVLSVTPNLRPLGPDSRGEAIDDRPSSSLAKIDREEEARPARTLMEPERFSCATGLSGKFDSDYALTTYALAVPACDRNLLGTSHPHLRCLAAGMFAFTLQEKRVQGTHLRAFHDAAGSAFRYVSQIQRALRVLGRVYDAIIHVDPKTQFFRVIFGPLIDLLDDGADRGLRDLPVAFVEERVSELLVKMSCVIRHPTSDQLSRDELLLKLTDALHLDLSLVITQGALYQMNQSSRRSSFTSASAGKTLKTPFRGRVNPVSTQPQSQRADKPCFRHMAFHLSVAPHGCKTGDRCKFVHDMSKFNANQLKAAAESVSNASFRNRLLDALTTKSETQISLISSSSSTPLLGKISPLELHSTSHYLNSLTKAENTSEYELFDYISHECSTSDIWETVDETFFISASAIDQALNLAQVLSVHFGIMSPLSSCLTKQAVLDLLVHCESEFGKENAVKNALRDFGDVMWSAEALITDSRDLHVLGDLTELIRLRHYGASVSRYNLERCDAVFMDDPEYATLRALATSGVVVDTNANFTRQTSPPPMRPLHKQLLPVYRHHAMKLWREGKALLLPPYLLEHAGCHFNPAHWTSKPGKSEGRFLGDCTNGPPDHVLNSLEVKDLVGRRFGQLSHPTISQIVDTIYEVSNIYGGISGLRLWKEDVVGAFSQFNYAPESASLFAFWIDDDLAMLQHTGMFGWTGSPYAFGVFSRALQRLALRRIVGKVAVYVDDFMGISPVHSANDDQMKVQTLLTEVFGNGAVNPEKSVSPDTCQEFLGWHIDIVREFIRPSDRAIRKLIFCFFGISTHHGQRIPLSQIQRVASLAYRYSQGIVGMTPFVYPLYHATKGPHSVKSRRLGVEARTCVTVWRCIALLLYAHPSHLAVPLRNFLSEGSLPTVRIWSDAGPHRLGVRVDACDDLEWLAYISYVLPFDASDPKYQNTREFMGVVLGMLMLSAKGYRNCTVMWRGDNVSALSWVQTNYIHSLSCQKAFFVYTWLSVWTQIHVRHTEHWRGVDMGDIDGLSRGYATSFDTYDSGLPKDFRAKVDDIFQHCAGSTSWHTLMDWGHSLVRGCIVTSSQKQYLVGWKHWIKFHLAYSLDHTVDFQRSLSPQTSSPSAIERTLAFVAYAYHILRLQSSTIGNYLAGISYHIRCGGGDTSFMNSPLIQMARSGITLLSRKQKAQCERGALPFTWGMIVQYRRKYGVVSARHHCIFTTLVLAFTLLLRSSEYIKSSANHYIRACDVVFETATSEWIPSYMSSVLATADITGVVVVVRSAKNDQLGEAHRLCFSRKDHVDAASCVCSILLDWALRAQLKSNDPFTSYRGVWHLSRWDIDTAVKSMARAFGLNVTRFTPHSLRYGGASALAAGGVSDAIIQATGRWKSLAFLQYLKLSSNMMQRSLSVLTDEVSFTVQDVCRLTNVVTHPVTHSVMR